MKTLESGKDKIQKICDQIRHQTIEPAQEEAESIIAEAKRRAQEIIEEAENLGKKTLEQNRHHIEQERKVFHSSLQQAAKQGIESLRQQIEKNFFNDELHALLQKQMGEPGIIANLVNAIVSALEKEGMAVDLSVVIPRAVSSDEVSRLLLDQVAAKLQNKPLELGNFAGGTQVKMAGKKMTIELTDQALKELVAQYIRKDFRDLVFNH